MTKQAAQRLLAIVGPTATGKSSLAIRLAERLGGEVVNADSLQVYRGMDIGTAKPSQEEQARVRHWLIDVADPDEPFSLGRYLDLAGEALRDCWPRGRLPILTGGTGQYVWALLEGWQVPRVAPDPELRARLEALLEQEGPERLAEELTQIDPGYAASIDLRNPRRVIRALEVHQSAGQAPPSSPARVAPDFAWLAIGLTCPREELYRRIDARVDAMIAAGLAAEVRALQEHGYPADLPAMSSIGYRQMCRQIAGELPLEEAIAQMKTETHRLARMQHNWFRRNDDRIHWIDAAAGDPFAEALRVVESKLRE